MNDLLSNAKWIWPENTLYLVNSYAGFRCDFELKEPLPEAPLHLTADQFYRLWINGKYVCRGPVRGHQKNWFYDTVDAAPYLRKGHNFIAVEAFNPGISTFSYHFEDRAGFLCAARWEDGTEIFTNRDSWTMFRLTGYASDTARLSVQMNFQEDLEKNTYWRRALYSYYMYGENNIRDYKAAVEAITAETVQQTLKKLVSAGNVFEVVMFPEN